jgi:hypothetical protein
MTMVLTATLTAAMCSCGEVAKITWCVQCYLNCVGVECNIDIQRQRALFLKKHRSLRKISCAPSHLAQGFNKAQISNFYVYPDYSPIVLHAVQCGAAEKCRSVPNRAGNGYGTCAVSSSGTASFPVSLRDTWFNNTCLQSKSADLFAFGACQPTDPNNGHIPILANNTYATGDGAYLLRCGNKSWDLASAQAAGIELGSQLVPMPSTQSIISTARLLLGF